MKEEDKNLTIDKLICILNSLEKNVDDKGKIEKFRQLKKELTIQKEELNKKH